MGFAVELLHQLLNLRGGAVAVEVRPSLGGWWWQGVVEDLFDGRSQGACDGCKSGRGRDLLVGLVAGERALKQARRLSDLDLS